MLPSSIEEELNKQKTKAFLRLSGIIGGEEFRTVNYCGRGRAIAVEFKKFFMNEWTGELYQDIHSIIGQLLEESSVSLVERISEMNR